MSNPVGWDVLPPVVDSEMASAKDSPSGADDYSLRTSSAFLGKSLGSRGGGRLVHLLYINHESACLGYIVARENPRSV